MSIRAAHVEFANEVGDSDLRIKVDAKRVEKLVVLDAERIKLVLSSFDIRFSSRVVGVVVVLAVILDCSGGVKFATTEIETTEARTRAEQVGRERRTHVVEREAVEVAPDRFDEILQLDGRALDVRQPQLPQTRARSGRDSPSRHDRGRRVRDIERVREVSLRVEFEFDERAESSPQRGLNLGKACVDVAVGEGDREMREGARKDLVQRVVGSSVSERQATEIPSKTGRTSRAEPPSHHEMFAELERHRAQDGVRGRTIDTYRRKRSAGNFGAVAFPVAPGSCKRVGLYVNSSRSSWQWEKNV